MNRERTAQERREDFIIEVGAWGAVLIFLAGFAYIVFKIVTG